jgi:hypothetical protein
MLIELFAPNPDAVEIHQIEIAASCEAVYRSLWAVDLGRSLVVKMLLVLRLLPNYVLDPGSLRRQPQKLTLHSLIEWGFFGRLAEEEGREVVLGIAGRFWRPCGNILAFNEENFRGSAPTGLARAIWNFAVQEAGSGRTILSTETRVVCGDAASRFKFHAYWLVVRPFSGLIRQIMLREVKEACESAA